MKKLTLQEEEAMLALWQVGKGFIKDLMDGSAVHRKLSK
jgi:BlaI family transcriptional regulator, penicillinase repressor